MISDMFAKYMDNKLREYEQKGFCSSKWLKYKKHTLSELKLDRLLLRVLGWCRRRDLNPHDVAITGF